MDNSNLPPHPQKDQPTAASQEYHSLQQKHEKIKSDLDSPDDFEHLGHDSSPLQEKDDLKSDVKDVFGSFTSTARDFATEINKEADKAAEDIFGPLKRTVTSNTTGMDSNLLEMGDTIPDKHTEHKLDTFLSEFKSDSGFQRSEGISMGGMEGEKNQARFSEIKAATQNFMDFERERIVDTTENLLSKMPEVPKDYDLDLPTKDVSKVPPSDLTKDINSENESKVVEDMKEKVSSFGSAFDTKPLLPEKASLNQESNSNDSFFQSSSQPSFDPFNSKNDPFDNISSISASSLPPELLRPQEKIPEKDEFKMEERFPKPSAPSLFEGKEIHKPHHIEEIKPEIIETKGLIKEEQKSFKEPEKPKKPVEEPKKLVDEPKEVPKKVEEPKKIVEEPKKIVEEIKKIAEDTKKVIEEPIKKPIETKSKLEKQVIEAEALFCNLGLDAWFHPERLNPRVESLIYWRDPKKSGPVFAGVLIVLLALTYFSLISVVAYLSLLILTGTISFRIYKNIVQAVQKTGDGHPFKEVLESEVGVPQDKAKEVSEIIVAHINGALSELRRLFLVEDLVDSIKFGVFLWCLTYLGAWFNGMTLVIIAWVALFTLPKVYEVNKTQIDNNLELVKSKLAEVTSKVKAAIPLGKKEEKKDQ